MNKLLLPLLALVFFAVFFNENVHAQTFIYKGSNVEFNYATGKTTVSPSYLLIGERSQLSTGYFSATLQMVFTYHKKNKKLYSISSQETVVDAVTPRSKGGSVESFTYHVDDSSTGHNAYELHMWTGVRKNNGIGAPDFLKYIAVLDYVDAGVSDSSSLDRYKGTYQLDKMLTNASINANDTFADAVNRVITQLQNMGYQSLY